MVKKMNASNHIYEFKGADKDLVHDTNLGLWGIIFKIIILTAILIFLDGMVKVSMMSLETYYSHCWHCFISSTYYPEEYCNRLKTNMENSGLHRCDDLDTDNLNILLLPNYINFLIVHGSFAYIFIAIFFGIIILYLIKMMLEPITPCRRIVASLDKRNNRINWIEICNKKHPIRIFGFPLFMIFRSLPNGIKVTKVTKPAMNYYLISFCRIENDDTFEEIVLDKYEVDRFLDIINKYKISIEPKNHSFYIRF